MNKRKELAEMKQLSIETLHKSVGAVISALTMEMAAEEGVLNRNPEGTSMILMGQLEIIMTDAIGNGIKEAGKLFLKDNPKIYKEFEDHMQAVDDKYKK